MLGYRGVNCPECSSYTTTTSADKDLLEKAAARSRASAHRAPAWGCLGCAPAGQQFLSKFCATCKVRACAIEKKLQNCAACAKYDACAEIKAILARESKELGLRMTWLRGRYDALTER
jgi:hypothetical protein